MKASIITVAAVAALAASGALAQEWRSQQYGSPPAVDQPPAGAYQGYSNSRDLPQEQTAQMPSSPEQRPADPGTLRRFNSNSGYGPEVQFETDRREAAQRARELEEQQRQQGWR